MMTNHCIFSDDRVYRYTLEHRINELAWVSAPPKEPAVLPWIGLNPSTADESQLDPTLRRIRNFTLKARYQYMFGGRAPWDGFVMLNLFAFRATDPAVMKAHAAPIGPDNDAHLFRLCKQAGECVACWGTHGDHLNRAAGVHHALVSAGVKVWRIGPRNLGGSPRHPLYLPDNSEFQPL